MLSTWHPEPADNGRKQRTRGMMAALSESFDILLVSLLPPDEIDKPHPRVDTAYRQEVMPLPAFESQSVRGLSGLLGRYPRSANATWSRATSNDLNRLLVAEDVEAAIGTDLRTLRYLAELPSQIVTILDEPDVSPFVVTNGSGRLSPGALRGHLREWKYRNFLGHDLPRIDASVVASEQEVDALHHMQPNSEVYIISNAIDSVPPYRWGPAAARPGSLLYTGSMAYGPNAEAVGYLVEQVIPHLRPQMPEVRVLVTGAIPDPIPAIATDEHVYLTGRLPYLDAAYLHSQVFVVPLWSGTGTRIKLIEAMAFGMPIVSTTKGAEGLPVRDGVHLLLADSAADFAGAILKLNTDPALSLKLGRNGRELVRTQFTWQQQGARLRELISGILETREVYA